MTGSTELSGFDREFADFSRRIRALRSARPSSPPDLADALFTELELAEEELRVIRDQVAEQDREILRRSDAADRERTLLRSVLSELPVPVFVLDHDGLIRRANGAAAELLGTSSAYVTGKPFPVFVDLTAPTASLVAGDRAAAAPLHSQVLRTGRAVLRSRIRDENALGVTAAGRPVLAILGAGSVLGIPLRAGDSADGVLTLVRSPARPAFDLPDLRVLEEVGGHLALALRAERRYRRRSDTAEALQASLLPRVPAPMPGLDWAAACRPGTQDLEVGGDFYDFFPSPGGWGVVLGDVCGKGGEAAAVTAMARHGIRVLSIWDDQPARVLAKVNEAMMSQQETDRFVTAVAAHLRWHADRLSVRLASAGHPAAVLVRAGGAVCFASGGGLPLGMFGDAEMRTEHVALRAGDTLVLYSDGVTERRAADGSFYGTARLAGALTRSLGHPAASIVRTMEDDLFSFSEGTPGHHDDVAIVAVRVVGPPD